MASWGRGARTESATSLSRDRRNLLVVAAVKALIGLAVLAAGFVAVSDDDFARIVIAQTFAVAPSFDPSGTSWLPAPFWFYGATLAAFGRTLLVARMTAWVLGIVSVLLVYRAARWLDIPPAGALAGSLLASAIPHSAWLGVAPVPEAPTAALSLLALASLVTPDPRRRLYGASALLIATLCRYEAWPVAAIFAAYCTLDALRGDRARRGAMLLAAITSVGGAIGWIVHGALHHGDALFFVHRVAEYQQALGGAPDFFLALFRYPAALVFAEPEIAVLAVLGWLGTRGFIVPGELARYTRPAVGLGALLAFVVLGAITGSAATHHFERSLLPAWYLVALFAGDRFAVLRERSLAAWRTSWATPRARLFVVALLLVAAGARFRYPRDSFANRSAEIDIGGAARRESTPNERLLVDTNDFGFFAVIAAFGRPENAEALRLHDPRAPETSHDRAAEAMLNRAAASRANWLVAESARAAELSGQTSLVARTDGLTLLRIKTR